ncbi:MAG: TonB-dependent receptor [candidate division WOR-3 bacterium]|nr:TonB-dependent receptor [candidate division WOR-3 bacterium]MCX7947073.1 TonB-dependent receptor [candidate division WOR-3 bacterium]MDW8149886.1 TonB-dependent receptor [candidate division WOR-3 bacterium]
MLFILTLEDTFYTLPEVEVRAFYYKKVENTKISRFLSKDESQIMISAYDKIEEGFVKLPNIGFIGRDAHGAVPTVRGLARFRTIALLDGYRMTTDREIGPSTYFAISNMFEGVEILEGSGASSFGSGAMGGSIIYYLKGVNSKNEISLGYGTNGNNYKLFAGYKPLKNLYVAGGLNISDNYFYPDTTLKESLWTNSFVKSNNSSFKKYNFLTAYKYRDIEFKFAYFRIVDLYRAIFGSAVRIYPKDEQFFFVVNSNNFNIGYHYYNFISTTIRKDTSETNYIGQDFGITYNYRFLIVDYFGRINVNSRIFKNSQYQYNALKNAHYNNFGITLFNSNTFNQLLLSYAFRIGLYNQENNFNFSPSGHIGAKYNINQFNYVRGNLQFAYRFPELTETKVYEQRTRGFLTGNPNLKAERAINTDFTIGTSLNNLNFEISGFYNTILDYIEMTKLDTLASNGDTIFTYVNLEDFSHIYGVSLFTTLRLNTSRFTIGYTFMDSRAKREDKEIKLSDIPPNKIFSQFDYSIHRLIFSLNAIYSFRTEGSDIQASRPQYLMLNSAVGYSIRENIKFTIYVNNLNNVVAYRSFDPTSLPLPSRNVRFQLDWLF